MDIKKNKILILGMIIVLLLFVIWVAWGNTALELNTYMVSGENLPDSFVGFRIAQVSDLHNAQMGENNEDLINLLVEAEPDIIVITGDFIDCSRTDVGVSLAFAREAVKIAPCYYVTGNHESRVTEYEELREGLLESGVVVLEDESIALEREGESITLIGVHDPGYSTHYLYGDGESVIREKLDELVMEEQGYTILLSHRPELFEVYVESGVNLVFSGHAHGGQFRLPFVGGLLAPHQGLFPKYDAGLFHEQDTTLVVSRGIGNSSFPFRLNNRPEVILIELE